VFFKKCAKKQSYPYPHSYLQVCEGSTGTPPHILNLGPSWIWSFLEYPWPIVPTGKTPRFLWLAELNDDCVHTFFTRKTPCHRSGGSLPAAQSGDMCSIPVRSMWCFCGERGNCTGFFRGIQFSLFSIIPPLLHTHSFTYHPRCIMFFSQYFSFPLSVSFHHCSILIHSSTTHAV